MKRSKPKPTPVFDEYKAQDDICDEILCELGVRLLANGKFRIERSGNREPAASVHHIFGGQNRRPDYWSNFCGVNFDGHDGGHFGKRGEPNRFKVLALLTKWKKSIVQNNTAEFVYEDLRAACGHLILPTVEIVSFEDGFLEVSRRQLVDVIAKLEEEQR